MEINHEVDECIEQLWYLNENFADIWLWKSNPAEVMEATVTTT